MAWNAAGSAQSGTSRQYSFASIGDGLSPTEATNLNTAVQTFQTALNRQV
jgi:phage-related protein